MVALNLRYVRALPNVMMVLALTLALAVGVSRSLSASVQAT